MKRLLLLITLVVVVGGAMWLGKTFPAANSSLIDLDLLWVRVPNLQVWQLMLISLGLGAFGGFLFMGFFWLRGWVVGRRYRKAIKRLESELHQLRSLPLAAKDDPAFTKALPGGQGKPLIRDRAKAIEAGEAGPSVKAATKPIAASASEGKA